MTLTFLKGTKQIIHYEIYDLKQNITFALCEHLVRQHIEMKAGTSSLLWKDVPAFRKITGFRVWLPGEEHPEKWLVMWVSLYMSLSSIIFELCPSQLRILLLIYPQCISGMGNMFLLLTFGKTEAGADPVPGCSNTLLPLQLKLILRQFLLFPNEKKILTLQNAAIDLALTREILLKWISNKAVKLTALISLQCKTYLIMQ